MRLTPDDIVNYPLRQSVRGYSTAQVDELLDEVADEVERLLVENADLRRRLDRAESKVDELAETEVTLKRTLVTAQRAAEQTLEDARQRAAEILEQARREAEDARSEALEESLVAEDELNRRRQELAREVAALREFEQQLRRDLGSVHERDLGALDDAKAAPVPEVGPPLPPPPSEPESLYVEEPPEVIDEDEAEFLDDVLEEPGVEVADVEAELEPVGEAPHRRRRRREAAADTDGDDDLIGGEGPAVDERLFEDAPPPRTRRR